MNESQRRLHPHTTTKQGGEFDAKGYNPYTCYSLK